MDNELAQPLRDYTQNGLTENTWEHIVALQAAEIMDLREKVAYYKTLLIIDQGVDDTVTQTAVATMTNPEAWAKL